MAECFFISQFYRVTQQSTKQNLPPLIKVANRYVKVLHYNPQTHISLTNQDIKAVLEYIDFNRQLYGYQGLSYAEKSNFNKYLPQYYTQLNAQQQAAFVIMPIVWHQTQWQWQRLTPQQKQQVVAQHRAAITTQQQQQMAQPNYSNNTAGNYQTQPRSSSRSSSSSLYHKQQMFNIMNNINQNTHMTSLNIIENMGGTGNYWEMTPTY